jgi:hypothetical protein
VAGQQAVDHQLVAVMYATSLVAHRQSIISGTQSVSTTFGGYKLADKRTEPLAAVLAQVAVLVQAPCLVLDLAADVALATLVHHHLATLPEQTRRQLATRRTRHHHRMHSSKFSPHQTSPLHLTNNVPVH